MSFDSIFSLTQIPPDWFNSQILLATLIVVTSFVLEDAALALSLYLIQQKLMNLGLVFGMLSFSLIVGDMALYALGRWLNGLAYVQKIKQRKLFVQINSLLYRNTISVILVSRIIPGMRLMTYTTAGLMKLPITFFFGLITVASIVWSGLSLQFGSCFVEILALQTHLPIIWLVVSSIGLIVGVQLLVKYFFFKERIRA